MPERSNDPAVAVAVASRRRPLRLRWLLNALAAQTFPAELLEVVVAADVDDAQTQELLTTHELRATGQLRPVAFPTGSGYPGAGRNAAWRATRAALLLFTDDDCRPDPDWVARAVAAAERAPGAIVQGRTLPDPDEAAVLRGAPWAFTIHVEPPTVWAETCNIAYPRGLLEALEGFDTQLRVGEDTDLAQRARATGARIVAEPAMLVYHAVEARWLPAAIHSRGRWQHLVRVVKRHPELRSSLAARIFWKREHAALLAALVGLCAAGHDRRAVLAVLPWLALSVGHRGYGSRGLVRSLVELPGRAAIDTAELVTLAGGSIRYRTLVL